MQSINIFTESMGIALWKRSVQALLDLPHKREAPAHSLLKESTLLISWQTAKV